MQEKDSLEGRVEDLECKFVFHQEALDTLSDQVTKQWQIIDALTKKLEKLTDQMSSFENEIYASGEAGGSEPPPPHY